MKDTPDDLIFEYLEARLSDQQVGRTISHTRDSELVRQTQDCRTYLELIIARATKWVSAGRRGRSPAGRRGSRAELLPGVHRAKRRSYLHVSQNRAKCAGGRASSSAI